MQLYISSTKIQGRAWKHDSQRCMFREPKQGSLFWASFLCSASKETGLNLQMWSSKNVHQKILGMLTKMKIFRICLRTKRWPFLEQRLRNLPGNLLEDWYINTWKFANNLRWLKGFKFPSSSFLVYHFLSSSFDQSTVAAKPLTTFWAGWREHHTLQIPEL